MRVGTPGFRGERLRAAREARCLSGAGLGEIVGVSRSAISQYENGDQTPSPGVLWSLADRLGVHPNYFLREPVDVSGGPLFYRSMSSATKAVRTRAERRYAWLREIVGYLQGYLRFPVVDVPKVDVPDDPLKITDRMIEDAATAVRRHWGLGDGPISNVAWLLENKGIVVSRQYLDSDKLDAFSQWASGEDRPYVVLAADKECAVRSRFDAGHELAHLVLHRDLDKKRLNKTTDFAVIEQQAHRFAGAFLLPAETFLADLHSVSLESLRQLKPRWNAAIALMLKRASDLGAVPDQQAERLWINWSRRGWRKEEPLDGELEPERPRFLKRCFAMLLERGVLTPDTLASHLPWRPQEIEDLACLDPGMLSTRETVQEVAEPELRTIRFPSAG